MIKHIQILFCVLIFISCNETEKNNLNSERLNNQDSLIIEENNRILFIDIIPENISDSSKTEIINELINEIDTDTSLVHRQANDSINLNIELFYRNDTLVKIINGNYPGLTLKTPNMLNHNYTAYYFSMDTLICSRYECNSYQQTGRCNPVAISVFSFIYNRKIISQKIDDKIGQYHMCGCGFSSGLKINKEGKTEVDYNKVKYLIEIGNTANTVYSK